MAAAPEKPRPLPTPTTQPYWDGLREHRLLLQFSPSAQRWVFYPRVVAPGTLVDDLEWREATGLGTLYSFTVARYPTAPPWQGDVPQLIAIVELDEGPRLTTEIVNTPVEELQVGMPVRAVFCDDPEGETILRFERDRTRAESAAGQ